MLILASALFIIHVLRVGANGFRTIANTEPNRSCLLYGSKTKEGALLAALFEEPLEGGSLQVHAKLYSNNDEAYSSVYNDLVTKYCYLEHRGSLNEDIAKVLFDPAVYDQNKCLQFMDMSKLFFKHLSARVSNNHGGVVPISNRLDLLFPDDCKSIVKILDGTRIVMHRAAYAMIAKYVQLQNAKPGSQETTVEAFIEHLITNVPLEFNWHTGSSTSRFDSGGRLIEAPGNHFA